MSATRAKATGSRHTGKPSLTAEFNPTNPLEQGLVIDFFCLFGRKIFLGFYTAIIFARHYLVNYFWCRFRWRFRWRFLLEKRELRNMFRYWPTTVIEKRWLFFSRQLVLFSSFSWLFFSMAGRKFCFEG